MTLLHELHHTGPGGSMVDTDELYGTGDVVNAMNVIRQELNMQWKNFGQRLNYKSVIPNKGATNSYLPFDQSSLNSIKEGVAPCVFSEYIKTSVKKMRKIFCVYMIVLLFSQCANSQSVDSLSLYKRALVLISRDLEVDLQDVAVSGIAYDLDCFMFLEQ